MNESSYPVVVLLTLGVFVGAANFIASLMLLWRLKPHNGSGDKPVDWWVFKMKEIFTEALALALADVTKVLERIEKRFYP